MLGIKNSMFHRSSTLGKKVANENSKPLGNKNTYAIDHARMKYGLPYEQTAGQAYSGPPVFEQYKERDHNDPKFMYAQTIKKKHFQIEKKHRFSRL